MRNNRGESNNSNGRYASNSPRPVPAPNFTAIIKYPKKEDNNRREGQ